jgi:hypothetical protein
MPSDAEIQAIIEKGGSPANLLAAPIASISTKSVNKGNQNILVQVPSALLEQIDALLAARLVKPTRSQWIREAMIEKLEKEVK